MSTQVRYGGMVALLVAGTLLLPTLGRAQVAPIVNPNDYVTRLIQVDYVNPALIALLFGGQVIYDQGVGAALLGGQGGGIGVMPGYGQGGYAQPTYGQQPYGQTNFRQPLYGRAGQSTQPYSAPGAYVGPPRGTYYEGLSRPTPPALAGMLVRKSADAAPARAGGRPRLRQ